jgi:hypothetical protein
VIVIKRNVFRTTHHEIVAHWTILDSRRETLHNRLNTRALSHEPAYFALQSELAQLAQDLRTIASQTGEPRFIPAVSQQRVDQENTFQPVATERAPEPCVFALRPVGLQTMDQVDVVEPISIQVRFHNVTVLLSQRTNGLSFWLWPQKAI